MKFERKLIAKFIPVNDESKKVVKILTKSFVEAIKANKK